ncbi:glycosyltransferase family 2 protein [Candidatus Pelagibacter sp. HIMB1509]|uniref:glycosyltransferase family 2 protein n=1 Tax=Candidatus Pelagibacter sp. HIMB1509 TaxID=3413339 RepID=UPI003F878B3A
MSKLQILLPVYNEALSIENTLKEIFDTLNGKIDFQFIISEDGSTDGTKEILKKLKELYPMILISDSTRKFYSKAVIDGIKQADADYLLIKDSDGQCDPNDILNFWNLKENSDLVNGYRYPRYDFAYRRYISKAFFIMYKILFNVPLRDPSFAYVFMNKKVYSSLNNFEPLMPDGFFWEFNARAKSLNFTFNEIKINHRKRSSGDTKIYTLKNLPRIAYTNGIGLLKLRFLKK